MRILICRSHGYRFSAALVEILGMTRADVDALPRHDQRLIAAVERLGDDAVEPGVAGLPKMEIVEVPDGRRYTIAVYDGREAVVMGLPETLTVVTGGGQRQVAVGEILDVRKLVEGR